MMNGIAVDYMGDGQWTQALHPHLKAANVFGSVPLPDITLNTDRQVVKYRFTLPFPVQNPFLQATHIFNVDHYFEPVNIAAGVWDLCLIGRVMRQQYGSMPPTFVGLYRTPATNHNGVQSRIIYGGFRG